MSDNPKRQRAKLFPIRLEGVYITPEQQAFIDREIHRRKPGAVGSERLRNSVVRDALDFASEQRPIFLAWIATRGNPAISEQEHAA